VTRVADFIFARLADAGLRHVFLVTGGGAMFLNDALRRETRLSWTCHHHEQAAAMAAEGYARITGIPGIVNVTSGPGGINALNGVFGAWTDSIPMIVLSGQVKRETGMNFYPDLPLRQLGDQEADIVAIASRVTKQAVQISDPADARYLVEKALWLATQGRPGPVWLDVPVDVQSADIDPSRLRGYAPEDKAGSRPAELAAQAAAVVDRLEASERPVILAGTGVRLAHAGDAFLRVAERIGAPVTTAWTHDLVPNDHPLWCGRQGTIGDRAGNFAVQASDLAIVLGSRLSIRQVSYNWGAFAPRAFKVQVDIDPAELRKPTVRPDLPIEADVGAFLEALEAELDRREFATGRHARWLAWCRRRTELYPIVQPHHRTDAPPINPYHFMECLFDRLGPRDVVVTGNGAACIMAFQAARLGPGQRLFSNSGSASMGYDLPAALGAAVALGEDSAASDTDRPGAGGRRRVICLAGDGSLQMNVQELQTLATHGWPVTVFVIDNGGYMSIRSTQTNFFEGRIGESRSSGVGFPDWVALAGAYGIAAARIAQPLSMREEIDAAMAASGPFLAHVVVDPAQGFEPRVRSRQLPDGTIASPALDDLYPFLSPEEAASNRVRPDGTLP
jgi:acetolactate synthase-1/2/3 large subunit